MSNLTVKEQKAKMIKIVDDTVKYYSKDPAKRRGYNEAQDSCEYLTASGQKCAVGRLLCKADLDFVKERSIGDFTDLVETFEGAHEKFKTRIINLLSHSFFSKLQSFHDEKDFWDSEKKTLSAEGITFVKDFKKKIRAGKYNVKKEK